MTAAFARRSPAAVALALATVYLVWGSTYLAIRVTDRTMPPFLMSSVRFLIAGAALYAFASRGRARPTLREWRAAAIVGAALLLVGNGGVAWAETRLDSGFAALIVADHPALGRADGPSRSSAGGCRRPAIVGLVIGFAGVAAARAAGRRRTSSRVLVLVATTSAWAGGSLYARGAPLPASPLLSAAMQMLAASVFLGVTGLVAGEARSVSADSFATKPLIAFVIPRPRRLADRVLRLRLAAEERPDLGRLDVRVRESRRRGRARNRVPERDDRWTTVFAGAAIVSPSC